MRKIGLFITMLALVAFVSGTAKAVKPGSTGNGLPLVSMKDSFLLNVHAVKKCPTNGFDGSNRNTIVVLGLSDADFADAVTKHGNNLPDITDKNDIELTKSDSADSFEVLDGNACDEDTALLALPPLVATTYGVYLKLVGKPGTQANPVLCARDLVTNSETFDVYCNTGSVHVRVNGQNKFVDVTDELLELLGTDLGEVLLFDEEAGSWFWDFSATKGAKAQVRFVPE